MNIFLYVEKFSYSFNQSSVFPPRPGRWSKFFITKRLKAFTYRHGLALLLYTICIRNKSFITTEVVINNSGEKKILPLSKHQKYLFWDAITPPGNHHSHLPSCDIVIFFYYLHLKNLFSFPQCGGDLLERCRNEKGFPAYNLV